MSNTHRVQTFEASLLSRGGGNTLRRRRARQVGLMTDREVGHMAFLVGVFEGDYDAFKQQFDSDPLGRTQAAQGHTMLRGVDDPNQIFLRVEFGSAEEARAFQEKVRGSNVLDIVSVKVPPTVAEMVDQATY